MGPLLESIFLTPLLFSSVESPVVFPTCTTDLPAHREIPLMGSLHTQAFDLNDFELVLICGFLDILSQ